MGILILLPILVPFLFGILINLFKDTSNKKTKNWLIVSSVAVTLLLTVINCFISNNRIEVISLTSSLNIIFKVDSLSKLFSVIISFTWLLITIYTFEYIKHEKSENRFYCFSLLSLAMLIALTYSGNLVTMYLCFEMITLCSMPLVLHSLSKESISAALKYLFYSIGGAFLALLGIFFLVHYTNNVEFGSWGGSGYFNPDTFSGDKTLYQVVIFLLIIGFGTKAGMFPMHGWLPTAHPVAPAPASAALSGIIAKAGVFTIIRVVYYIVGPDFLSNTWVQYAWLGLALFTVLMGSMMAFLEKVFKKRLAYSTVSQISYILTGLAFLTKLSFTGAILHVVGHMLIKTALFLFAGEVIYTTGKHDVNELRGIGKIMPISTWCYTIASLGLIGIPLTVGFISKWYLATGAIDSTLPVVSWLAPVILLISAILTAGYLLPVTINGFFVKNDDVVYEKNEPSLLMVIPMIVLAVCIVAFGIYAQPIISVINSIIG